MTELQPAAEIAFEQGIASECEQQDCWVSDELHAFVVTGDTGRDGVAVYCPVHAQNCERQESHTYLGKVTDYGGHNE